MLCKNDIDQVIRVNFGLLIVNIVSLNAEHFCFNFSLHKIGGRLIFCRSPKPQAMDTQPNTTRKGIADIGYLYLTLTNL